MKLKKSVTKKEKETKTRKLFVYLLASRSIFLSTKMSLYKISNEYFEMFFLYVL